MKKKNRLKSSIWITLFVGITFSYFIWLVWKKLTEWIGSSWVILGITGGIVLLAIIFGYFSINKIAKKFT